MIGGVGLSAILLRALVVLILVTVFAGAVNFIAVSFLDSSSDSGNYSENPLSEREGSNVNIVLTEDDDAISELPSEDIDEEDGNEDSPGSENKQPERSESSGNDSSFVLSESMNIDSLPDLGSFSTTFSSAADNEEKKTDSEVESEYNENRSFSSGRGTPAQGLAGKIAEQNKPEDLAKAVKTVLKREETN